MVRDNIYIAVEKLKENTCLLCGRLKLHAGCCKLGNLNDLFITLAIAQASLPIILGGLKKEGFLE